jgi:peroxiredoxin
MSFPRYLLIVLVVALTACGDLYPSGDDKRAPVDSSTIGASVGQIAPDFSLFDTEGNTVTMSAELASTDGIVLYYTMWCPICDSHMSHMRTQVIPNYPNVKFFIIDYVSGTVALSRTAQTDNGYTDMTVLVDNTQEALTLYQATMGTTVVIENAASHGIVRMNEDYKDSVKLTTTLDALP